MIREIIYSCTEFDWDEGNSEKNWIRHKVTKYECEEIFLVLGRNEWIEKQ